MCVTNRSINNLVGIPWRRTFAEHNGHSSTSIIGLHPHVAAHCTLELITVIHAIVCAMDRVAMIVTIAPVMIYVVHEFMRGYVAPLGMVPWCKSHTIARKEAHSFVLLLFYSL